MGALSLRMKKSRERLWQAPSMTSHELDDESSSDADAEQVDASKQYVELG